VGLEGDEAESEADILQRAFKGEERAGKKIHSRSQRGRRGSIQSRLRGSLREGRWGGGRRKGSKWKLEEKVSLTRDSTGPSGSPFRLYLFFRPW